MMFLNLNKYLIQNKFKTIFEEKNILTLSVLYENNDILIYLKNGDKVSINIQENTWFINNIKQGKILGETVYDVVYDYQFELSK